MGHRRPICFLCYYLFPPLHLPRLQKLRIQHGHDPHRRRHPHRLGEEIEEQLDVGGVEAPKDVGSPLRLRPFGGGGRANLLLRALRRRLAVAAHFGVDGEVAAQLSAVLEGDPDERVDGGGQVEEVDGEGKHQDVGEEVGVRDDAGEQQLKRSKTN